MLREEHEMAERKNRRQLIAMKYKPMLGTVLRGTRFVVLCLICLILAGVGDSMRHEMRREFWGI